MSCAFVRQVPRRSCNRGSGISRSRWLVLLACILWPMSRAAAQEGGIEVFAGGTLFETGMRVSVSELYKPKRNLFRGSNEVNDPLNQSLEEFRTVLGIDYGIDRNATLTALVPVVHRELRSGGMRFDATGLGDVALLGKYRIIGEEGSVSAFNVSVVGGLELPTGATDEREGGMRLSPSVQVGKGSWNPFLSTSATAGLDRARFDATVFYKFNTEGAQQLEPGDFFSVSVSAAYRFLHYKYPGPTVGARLGVQWRHEGRAEQNGVSTTNSGADELLLTPGLSIHPVPRVDLNIGSRIPLYQDYNGVQLGRDIEWFLAVGFRF